MTKKSGNQDGLLQLVEFVEVEFLMALLSYPSLFFQAFLEESEEEMDTLFNRRLQPVLV